MKGEEETRNWTTALRTDKRYLGTACVEASRRGIWLRDPFSLLTQYSGEHANSCRDIGVMFAPQISLSVIQP